MWCVLHRTPGASLSDLKFLDIPIPRAFEPVILHDERLLRSLLTDSSFSAFAEIPNPYILWPEGLRILLQFGKLVHRYHVQNACTLHLVESVTILVSVRQFYIDANILRSAVQTENVEIMKLIVDALVEERRELQSLVERHLSGDELASLQLRSKTLLRYQAHTAHELLKANGLELCKRVDRDNDDPWLVYASIRESREMADLLWHGGFQDVDDPDAEGYTSLMFCKDLEFADWLISHGAEIYRRVLGTPALHLMASNVDLSFNQIRFNHSKRSLRTFHLILQDESQDECDCPCSSSGCLAITCLFVELLHSHTKKLVRIPRSTSFTF